MSLFQNSVLKKYLKGIDSEKAEEAWNTFKTHFQNPEIQENIRNSKEEQYQGEFLIDLFVNVFGYIKNPNPNFNLTTELKNIKGAKKTDGAILIDDKAIAVIELKGTNTVDLSKVENQAFGYKNNQPGCKYVITSNFEKLRFYIDNAVEFEEFNLFQLTKDRFDTLYLCLSEENLLKGIPKQIKNESLSQEEAITKKLYKDYSEFRNEIFDNIQKQNSQFDKLTLFKKTQKILDRFLFIFFAEDRLLLPSNSIREIVNQWTTLKEELDAYVPLYDRFKKYFGYMDTGYSGKKHEIFAYNGGLFAPDDILDNIKIDDNLLYRHTVNLSNYDFESEVSVNILGHIFEHSLTEIETIQAQLEGIEIDKSKTKRKKDGVFYTPKYITKYIVDNTVGKLCTEKKQQLELDETEFEKDRKGRKKATLKKLLAQLDNYRNWLLQITICDPACGSGAFLNQALEFLIREHGYIDELKAKLLGDAMVFTEVQNDILENNLFGVDINNESVEIAKLSLWLRTAKKGRKLTSLNDNIKCGNSLIDNREIAHDKVFVWKKEFQNVFKKGGFDVIIGNPPYGAKVNDNELAELQKLQIGKCSGETYAFFYEKSSSLLKDKGVLGFITPDTWMRKEDFVKLRRFLLQEFIIEQIIETGPVFKDARDTWCMLLFIRNSRPEHENLINHLQINRRIVSIEERQSAFESEDWSADERIEQTRWLNSSSSVFGYLVNPDQQNLINKLSTQIRLGESQEFIISRGEEGSQGKFDTGEISDFFMVKPEQVSKYITKKGWYVNKTLLASGKLNDLYIKPKVFVIRIQKMRWVQRIVAASDLRENSSSLKTLQIIVTKEKDEAKTLIIESILNSKLINFWCINYLSDDINSSYLKLLPLPNQLDSNELVSLTKNVKHLILEKTRIADQIITLIKTDFEVDKLSRKLLAWYNLTNSEFILELNKISKKHRKVKLSKSEELEWIDVFTTKNESITQKSYSISVNEKEIEYLIYNLYNLNKDEIEVLEKAIA